MSSTEPASSTFTVLKIEGARTLDFLQGQMTCDLARCGPDQAARGAFCNRSGRVVADAVLLPPAAGRECWQMLLLEELQPVLMEFIEPYARLSRVRIAPDPDFHCRAFAADRTADYLQLETSGDQISVNLNPLGRRAETAPVQWGLAVESSPASPDADTVSDLIQCALVHRVPFVRSAASGLYTPHELGYPDADMVHFDKGCYLGQEVVARMQHLGKLKKHFLALALDGPGPWAVGDELPMASGGKLTLIEALQTATHWLLGACVPDAALADTELALADGSRARVLELPT